MNYKKFVEWGLIIFGAYELLLAQIPTQQASAIETLSSGSCTVSGVISSEIASGQLYLGGGALALGVALNRFWK